MKNDFLKMGITISTDTGSVLRPTRVKVMTAVPNPNRPEALPHAPFKYYTDAIIGLCFHKMTDFKHLPTHDTKFTEAAYNTLNPYIELFRKSAPRIQSLSKGKSESQIHSENFEKNLLDLWEEVFSADGVHLSQAQSVLDLISDYESHLGSPFLYNFHVHFSDRFKEKLIAFYSFLFHLRSVVAIDHNAYVEDSSLESVKCDSISDYLPKSDYTANDALLYWNFKKLSHPFVAHKDKDVRIEKLLVQPLESCFQQYNHNACCLIDQLPSSFLNSLSQAELEETLHHVQMDWLLGSSSGLLFKIREEVFGLIEGYDRVFWPETMVLKPKPSSQLKLSFQITNQDLNEQPAAA